MKTTKVTDESGFWYETIHDKHGFVLKHRTSEGYWFKFPRAENGDRLTYEESGT